MVEQGTRIDRLVSIDVVERFEALQDEVDLLKNEIKQTLVDLREHMMKGRTVFSELGVEPQRRTPPPPPPRVVYTKGPSSAEVDGDRPKSPLGHFAPGPRSDGMDPVMLGNIIGWLGTVKQMGLSLQQVTPFLEAYEASGYLPPIMLKVLLRSLADLDQMTDSPPEDEFSPQLYAECLGQLHDIICAAMIVEELPLPDPALPEAQPETSTDDEPMDRDGSPGKSNGRSSKDREDSTADKYKLTTIQVPDFEDDLGSPETTETSGRAGGLDG